MHMYVHELNYNNSLDCSGQLKATGLVGAYRDLVVKMWREDNYYGLRPEQLAVSPKHCHGDT